ALSACEGAPPSEAPASVDALQDQDVAVERVRKAPGVDYIFYPGEPMKPAYRTAFEPLKADEQDDIRWSNPERYSITTKPPAAARPMVEWEPMQSIVMSTPQWITTYAGAKDTVTQIAVNAATVGEVWFVVDTNTAVNNLKGLMVDAGMNQDVMDAQVKFLIEPIDSIWFIDSGPFPLVDDATDTFAFTDFRYYWDRALDDGIPTFLGRNLPDQAPISTYRMPLNTEGGTIQATSDGICITGNRQLYYMSCDDGGCDQDIRTMPLDEVQTHPLAEEVRQIWKDYAGCKDTIITHSITDDGTGHIDMYLKIASDNVVIIGDYMEELEQSEVWTFQTQNRERMDENAAFLEAYVKPDGTS
ncbi:MAG: agmatine deiminase family protein, partial [Myxococcota bacterium]|nr:agmatine deiminase family protein [Myxococcota bacterium]